MRLIKLLGWVSAIIFLMGFVHPSNGCAGNYTILHNFAGGRGDGEYPDGSLVTDGTTLYGMTSAGGAGGEGVVFKTNIDGKNYTLLHSFGSHTVTHDGELPTGSLLLSGSILYGTTSVGGAGQAGTVFKINTDGSHYTILHSFLDGTVAHDGVYPQGSLILSGSILYGTTWEGGVAGQGTVFKVNIEGTPSTSILYSFSPKNSGASGKVGSVPNDGANPYGNLTLSGSTLYGMTVGGGVDYPPGLGVAFKINTDGKNHTVLHLFFDGTPANDGWEPYGSFLLSGSTLYATTEQGGTNAEGGPGSGGTVFKMNTGGAAYTILHSFGIVPIDGTGPMGSLILSGATLYGMTCSGGAGVDVSSVCGEGGGTVFKINTNGSHYAILHSFGTVPNDGIAPQGSLVLSGSILYGMTFMGGSHSTTLGGLGTIFSLKID